MKSHLLTILFLFLWLVACTSAPTTTSLPMLTATMIPLPTATATVTETSTPMLTATSTTAPTATATNTPTLSPTVTPTLTPVKMEFPKPPILNNPVVFTWIADYANPNTYQQPYAGSTIKKISDPTKVFDEVVETTIFDQITQNAGLLNDGRHRAYIQYGIFLRPSPRENFIRGLPAIYDVSMNIQKLQNTIGTNIDRDGARAATFGDNVWALAGDRLINDGQGGYLPAMETALKKHNEKWYIIPMTHDRKTKLFTFGQVVDESANISIGVWYDFRTIETVEGIWTLMRQFEKGQEPQNGWKVMGYVQQLNPEGAYSGHFGPYAIWSVKDFSALQINHTVRFFGSNTPLPNR